MLARQAPEVMVVAVLKLRCLSVERLGCSFPHRRDIVLVYVELVNISKLMTQTITKMLERKLPAMLLYISSTFSLTVGIVAQSAALVVLARFLGTEQFGYLATITAATNLGAPWCGLGGAEALRRRASRDPSLYPNLLGHSLILLSVSGAVLTLITIAALSFFVHVVTDPIDNLVILLLQVPCNLLLYPWICLVEQILLTHGQFSRANAVNAGFGVMRASTALVACLVFGVQTLHAWAIWNAVIYAVASLACVAAIASFGAPRWTVLRDEVPLGATLSISGFLSMLRTNIDLLALAAVATPQLVGAYGAARRVVGTAVVTGGSLNRLVYAKLAIAGQSGLPATLRLVRGYLAYAIALTGATSIALFVTAPLMPWIFGKSFGDATGMVKILCWTLILTSIQNFAFDSFNATDRHRVRVIVASLTSALGTAIIAILTYRQGITGTFVGIYLAEGLMAATLWTALKALSDRYQRPAIVTE